MAKISNVQTAKSGVPAEIKQDPNQTESERDSLGRTITCKRITFLDTHRITRLLGVDADNQAAVNQAMVTCSVIEIDGDRIPTPTTMAQLEALMQRLDFPGVNAAVAAVARLNPPLKDTDADSIKNS